MSEDWMRDRIIMIERELGGHAERTRSLEHSDSLIRREVAEIGQRITEEMNRQHAHLRGELNRLAEAMASERAELRIKIENTMITAIAQSQQSVKEQRRVELEEQNRQIKEELERGKRNLQWALVVFGIIILGVEKVLEYTPQILELISNAH